MVGGGLDPASKLGGGPDPAGRRVYRPGDAGPARRLVPEVEMRRAADAVVEGRRPGKERGAEEGGGVGGRAARIRPQAELTVQCRQARQRARGPRWLAWVSRT